MTRRIRLVVTSGAHFADPSESTGLWLSELTHAKPIPSVETRCIQVKK